jgi:hypothetical protein
MKRTYDVTKANENSISVSSVKLLRVFTVKTNWEETWFENRGIDRKRIHSMPMRSMRFHKICIPEDDINIDICLYVDDLLTSSTNGKIYRFVMEGIALSIW